MQAATVYEMDTELSVAQMVGTMPVRYARAGTRGSYASRASWAGHHIDKRTRMTFTSLCVPLEVKGKLVGISRQDINHS